MSPYVFFGSWASGIAGFAGVMAYGYCGTSLVASYAIGVNVASLIVMGLDKSLSASGSLRVPEKVLFALAVLGGGVGILLGMHVFRHKTRKVAFQCFLMLIFMAQFFLASKLGIELRNSPLLEDVEFMGE